MSGANTPRSVTSAGIALAAALVRIGRDPTEATMHTVAAWADLPMVEGRWLTATAASWLASHLVPELIDEGDRNGVDLRPWLAETLAIADASVRLGDDR